jgi:putative RecB family exonuclease
MSTGLLGFQSVQDRQGGVREYISPSRLGCWLACPLRFRFRYLDGIRMPTSPARFVGKATHAALEVFYRHQQLGIILEPGEVTKKLLESWGRLVDEEEARFQSVAEEQGLQKQVRDLVTAYMAFAPPQERPLAVETPLEAPLIDPRTGEDLGMPLLGVVDLVLDYEAGPLVVDFKTSARSSEPIEVIHEIQLTSYAHLFRQSNPWPESGLEIRSLIKTKVAKVEFHGYPPRTEGHFKRLFAVVREYLDALDAGRFNYRPGFGCGMCDYRTECARWGG